MAHLQTKERDKIYEYKRFENFRIDNGIRMRNESKSGWDARKRAGHHLETTRHFGNRDAKEK